MTAEELKSKIQFTEKPGPYVEMNFCPIAQQKEQLISNQRCTAGSGGHCNQTSVRHDVNHAVLGSSPSRALIKPRILIACEFSGIVREEFRKTGCDAWSCDLLPTEIPGQHIQDDVLKHLNDGWDLMIAHPPCTYLCVSGAAHFNKPGRKEKQIEALEFVRALLDAPIEHIALENPVGVISTAIRKPDQYIQPYEHGHEHMKKTGLWLKNLPCLTPSKMVGKGEIWVHKNGRTRGSRWHMCLSPSPDRWKIRSRTFPGIAKAFAEQWSPLLTPPPCRFNEGEDLSPTTTKRG